LSFYPLDIPRLRTDDIHKVQDVHAFIEASLGRVRLRTMAQPARCGLTDIRSERTAHRCPCIASDHAAWVRRPGIATECRFDDPSSMWCIFGRGRRAQGSMPSQARGENISNDHLPSICGPTGQLTVFHLDALKPAGAIANVAAGAAAVDPKAHHEFSTTKPELQPLEERRRPPVSQSGINHHRLPAEGGRRYMMED